jgi:hypothetical protein
MGLLTGIISNKAEKNDYDGLNFTENDMTEMIKNLPGKPIWEMHKEENGILGKVVAAEIGKDKVIKVMVNIDENTEKGKEVMRKVRNGTYKGFSCGTDNEIADYMKPTMKVVGKKIKEISVVDDPDVKGAVIEFIQSEHDKKDAQKILFDENGNLKKNANEIYVKKIPKNNTIQSPIEMTNTIKSGSENAKYKLSFESQNRRLPRLDLKSFSGEQKMAAPTPTQSNPVETPAQTVPQTPSTTQPEITSYDKLKFLVEKTGMSPEELAKYALEKKAEEEKKQSELRDKYLATVADFLKDNGIENPAEHDYYKGIRSMTPEMIDTNRDFMLIATQAGAKAQRRMSEMESEYQKMKSIVDEYQKKESEIAKERRVSEEISNMMNNKRKTISDMSQYGFKLPRIDLPQQTQSTQPTQPNQATSSVIATTNTVISTTASSTAPTNSQPQTTQSSFSSWRTSAMGVPMDATASVRQIFPEFDMMSVGVKSISASDFDLLKKKK